MFDTVTPMSEPVAFRWKTTDDDGGQPKLFAEEELVDRHVGIGEYRGLEFFHVNARRIINEVPAASRMPFRYTINAFRGCSHACVFCLQGETPILMGDGRIKPLADVRVGDVVYGTERVGSYRRYVHTPVLAHWSTIKPAYRVSLKDGTELIASGDHGFLSERGWKHVANTPRGHVDRAHLTLNNELKGTGRFASPPRHDADYRRGYLCGMIRGDGHVGRHFRLGLVDFEGLARTRNFLSVLDVATREFTFKEAVGNYQRIDAIVASGQGRVDTIRTAIAWPVDPSDDWRKGFLSGIFDAEGSFSKGILRISNTDPIILSWVTTSLQRLGFRYAVEARDRGEGNKRLKNIRILGGLVQMLRFFHSVDPAITRKRSIEGLALKSNAKLGIASIEPLGVDLPMYDITTGTGDFIANGVVSHNCFARPTHEYLGFNTGEDFDRKLVVKVNAVEKLRAELRSSRWRGDHIAMGTNTDPYQRAEGRYHLTRGIVEVLGAARNPFSILTKSTLILRDLDVLTTAAEDTDVHCNLSIGTLDEEVWKATEPGTPHPRRRVEAVKKLNDAGIPTGVLVAPIIPGWSDSAAQLEAVATACLEAGAVSVTPIVLHLRPGVKEHFLGFLKTHRPDLGAELAGRYCRRSYLSPAQQQVITDRVTAVVSPVRTRRAPTGTTGHPTGRRDDPEATPRETTTPAEQLELMPPG
jgi:DNA repair photolyase